MSFELQRLRVRRGERTLLDVPHLRLETGHITAILGPNGAGKTTLLRVLAGELTPDAGAVLLDDRTLAAHGRAGLARRRAVLPQLSGLRFPFTAEEVIRLGRLPHGDEHGAAGRAAVERALIRTGLEALRDAPYLQLSGGERQRVHWARALAQIDGLSKETLPWLLLDEPTSALDLAHVHGLLSEAQSFAHAGGGVLLVVHDPNLAGRYAKEVILMTDGRIRAAGPADRVLSGEQLSSVYGLALERIERPGEPPIVAPARPSG